MEAKLKLCPNPWCKEGATSVESMTRGPAYVACSCGVRGPTIGWECGEQDAREQAITAWNTRAPDPDHAVLSLLAGRMAEALRIFMGNNRALAAVQDRDKNLVTVTTTVPTDEWKQARALLAEWDAAQKQQEAQCES
jgi:hypothetical protein